MKVKCAECGVAVEKNETVRYKNKNYHSLCLVERQERDELHETICELFKLKSPGPRVFTQIKRFKEEGLSYVGIKQALLYFYEVKGNSTTSEKAGLGIVPYVYKDANYYFSRIEKKKEQIAASATNFSNEIRTVYVKTPITKPKKKIFFDMNDI